VFYVLYVALQSQTVLYSKYYGLLASLFVDQQVVRSLADSDIFAVGINYFADFVKDIISV